MFESIGQNEISQKHRRDNFIWHTIQKKYLILIHEHIFLQTIIKKGIDLTATQVEILQVAKCFKFYIKKKYMKNHGRKKGLQSHKYFHLK